MLYKCQLFIIIISGGGGGGGDGCSTVNSLEIGQNVQIHFILGIWVPHHIQQKPMHPLTDINGPPVLDHIDLLKVIICKSNCLEAASQ